MYTYIDLLDVAYKEKIDPIKLMIAYTLDTELFNYYELKVERESNEEKEAFNHIADIIYALYLKYNEYRIERLVAAFIEIFGDLIEQRNIIALSEIPNDLDLRKLIKEYYIFD